MNERISKMDDFLKYLATIASCNPDFKITHGSVYGEYTRIGLQWHERSITIDENFPHWINNFSNVPNIDVFHKEQWKFFCRFRNHGERLDRSYIKMYIPLAPKAILHGTEMIFSFLAQNNIRHESKVGSHMRNDCIVVRVTSKEDSLKLARYINDTPYLKDNLIKPNPFLLNDGNIAYATDGNLSYNSVMSDYIVSYLNGLPNEERRKASVKGLFDHIRNKFNDIFVSGKKEVIEEFEALRGLRGLDEQNKIKTMANAMEITKLIIYSLNGENNLNRVMQIYDEMMNPNHMQLVENTIKNHYDKNKEVANPTVDLSINKEQILYNATLKTYEAYGHEHAKKALEKYIIEGFTKGFTRNDNARGEVVTHLTKEDAINIITQACGSLNYDLYINHILDKKALEHKENIFMQACLDTMEKYGLAQSSYAISQAINGVYKGFTNSNNGRNLMVNNVAPKDIEVLMKSILIKNGIDNEQNIQAQFVNLLKNKRELRKTEQPEPFNR